jgi:two-component system sensor histidine kinase UhpB
LTWKLTEIEENERKTISRELHDQIGQNLAILGLNSTSCKTLMTDAASNLVRSRLQDSIALVKQTTVDIRNLIADLRSPVLDDYGLVAAVKLYTENNAPSVRAST